jgi:hypothetical protein
MFQSSSLTTLVVTHLDCFPVSTLHAVSAVRKLEFVHVALQTSDIREVVLPRLESLKIVENAEQSLDSESESDLVQLGVTVPNLRQISIDESRGSYDYESYSESDDRTMCVSSFEFAQQAINASGKSLEQLWWAYDLTSRKYIIIFLRLTKLPF